MSASERTTNLNLPKYADTDITSWADFNDAMNIIDTSVGEIRTKSDSSAEAIKTIETDIIDIRAQQLENNNTTVRIEGEQDKINSSIRALNTTVENHSTRISALESGGGTGEIREELETVKNDLNQANNDLTALETRVTKNTTDISGIRTDVDTAMQLTDEIPEILRKITDRITFPVFWSNDTGNMSGIVMVRSPIDHNDDNPVFCENIINGNLYYRHYGSSVTRLQNMKLFTETTGDAPSYYGEIIPKQSNTLFSYIYVNNRKVASKNITIDTMGGLRFPDDLTIPSISENDIVTISFSNNIIP